MLYPRQHVIEPKSNQIILAHSYVLAFRSHILHSFCRILTNMYCTDCIDIKKNQIPNHHTLHGAQTIPNHRLQAPFDFMLRGFLVDDGETIGLANLNDYWMSVMLVELLGNLGNAA